MLLSDRTDCFDATPPRETKIHQSYVWAMPIKLIPRVFAAWRLGYGNHVRPSVDDRSDADAHDRMIVHYEYLDFVCSLCAHDVNIALWCRIAASESG